MKNELNPSKIAPTVGRAIVRKLKAADRRGSLYIPSSSRQQSFAHEGEVIAINEAPGGDAETVKPGDKVWFSAHVADDDSRFFGWGEEDFVLIPTEAIQAVAA